MDSPELKPTHPNETTPGLNDIIVKTAHYGLQKMIMEKDVPVKMRDGVTLYVNVFRSSEPGKYPVMMSADMYGKDVVWPESDIPNIPNVGYWRVSLFTPAESPDPGFWVPNGYVVVKAALRGSSNSEGSNHPLSDTEARDYYELIEWAGTQEWSNGNVGINGVSYLAMVQWKVAALNPPHLKAMMPWEGVSDLYREWAFHGGMPDTLFYRWWHQRQQARWPEKEVEDLTSMQKEHPLFDEYWEGKKANLSEIKVPMYAGVGWATQGLHNRGTIEGFRQSASKYKWLEVHGRKEWEYYYGREVLERQKRFFDYFLKSIENDWLDTPRVRIEVRERFYEGTFRLENEWTLARTSYTKVYLDGKNKTLSSTPVRTETKISYSVERGERDKQSLTFKLTFREDTELTGYMKLKLLVSAAGSDDMDLFVGVKKLDRRGNEVYFPDFNHIENGQVATGWLRVSHRELDPEKSTPFQPWLKHKRALKLKEGEIVPVEIEILPSSTLFRGGESLELVVKGTEIITGNLMPPRYEHIETVNKGKHIIYTGGKYDSHLLLPVITKD
ncbi:MAG: CocE/NonD family hydrolase [Chloroflexota bacterium]